MVHASFVCRLVGVALALTLPVACGSSSAPESAPAASAPTAAPPDQMTFSHSLPDGEDCHSSDVGVYRFTLAGKVLRLRVVNDTCAQREEILVGHDLTLAASS
jgi:hypothetical protein